MAKAEFMLKTGNFCEAAKNTTKNSSKKYKNNAYLCRNFLNKFNSSSMKKLFLMIIPALICGVAFTGCNADNEKPEATTNGGLYVVGAKSATVPADIADLVFTGDDIVSFDVLSGEIVFTEEKFDDIMSRVSLHTELHFFIDDKPVFAPPIQIHYGWGVSFEDFDLQFRTDGHKIHLTEWYMIVDSLPEVDRELKQLEMEANRQHRKKELEVFVEYLSNAGKTERSTVLPPYFEKPNEIGTGGTDTLKIEGKFVGAFSVKYSTEPVVNYEWEFTKQNLRQ